MPKQAARPMSLVHSHEIVKLRIFTNLNKRRKRYIPRRDVHHHPEHHRNDREQADLRTLPSREPFQTPPTITLRSKALSLFPDMKRVKKLQGAMEIQQWTTPGKPPLLPSRKDQLEPSSRQAPRVAALKCCTGPSHVTEQRPDQDDYSNHPDRIPGRKPISEQA